MVKIHFAVDYENDSPAVAGVRALLDSGEHTVLPVMPIKLRRMTGSDGVAAAKRWISSRLNEAELVIVLVGRATYAKPLVRFEIAAAAALSKPMFGLDVTTEAPPPPNPFAYVVTDRGRAIRGYPFHRLSHDNPVVSLSDFVHIATRHINTTRTDRGHPHA
jgi:hypothetical protein